MGIVAKAVGGFFLFIFLLTMGVEIAVGIQSRDAAGFAVLIVLQLLLVFGVLRLFVWTTGQVRSVVQYLIR